MRDELWHIKVTLRLIFFVLCFIAGLLASSCSSEDEPKPQVSCEVLAGQLSAANRAITDHQAKGSQGNPEAWRAELKRLTVDRDKIQGEFTTRHCL